MTHQHKAAGSEKNTPAELKTDEGKIDNCRCKEVSRKTVPEMIRLMIKDLTFWRKNKP